MRHRGRRQEVVDTQSHVLRLSRADRPIGTWLLLIPCWWGLGAAALRDGAFTLHHLWIAIGCALGAWLMRGAGWEFPVRDETWLRYHLIVALIAVVLLVLVVGTGLARIRAVHVRLYALFLPAFTLSILFSLLAFDLW